MERVGGDLRSFANRDRQGAVIVEGVWGERHEGIRTSLEAAQGRNEDAMGVALRLEGGALTKRLDFCAASSCQGHVKCRSIMNGRALCIQIPRRCSSPARPIRLGVRDDRHLKPQLRPTSVRMCKQIYQCT